MRSRLLRLSYKEVSEQIKLANPEFHQVLESVSPNPLLPVYELSVPFGSPILKKGVFYVPTKHGEFLPISDHRVSPEIRKDFKASEGGLPYGLVVENGYELFIDAPNAILPIVAAGPGDLIALWKQLDHQPSYHPINLFNINAGGRSLFLLPNITDSAAHARIRRDYCTRYKEFKGLSDQWAMFKGIADNECGNWRLRIFLFPDVWMNNIKHNEAWKNLAIFLYQKAWNSSAFERNQPFYGYELSCALDERVTYKRDPYLLDTARHLLAIVLGASPAFSPATTNLMGPISLFQKALCESYRLVRYTPTIMHVKHFNAFSGENDDKLYYSLRCPTTISFSPKSKSTASSLAQIRDLKEILKDFMQSIRRNSIRSEGCVLAELPSLIKFQYFHHRLDSFGQINLSENIATIDPSMNFSFHANAASKFAHNGQFVRACVQIACQEEK